MRYAECQNGLFQTNGTTLRDRIKITDTLLVII